MCVLSWPCPSHRARSAQKKEIIKAYRKLAQQWHPDNFQDPEEKKKAEKKFIDIAQAKEVLTDPGGQSCKTPAFSVSWGCTDASVFAQKWEPSLTTEKTPWIQRVSSNTTSTEASTASRDSIHSALDLSASNLALIEEAFPAQLENYFLLMHLIKKGRWMTKSTWGRLWLLIHLS